MAAGTPFLPSVEWRSGAGAGPAREGTGPAILGAPGSVETLPTGAG